jgi:hypothetical protein
VTPNLWLAGRSIGIILGGAPAVDWNQYVEAANRFWNGGVLFEWTATYGYHYSPLLAPFFGLLTPIGTIGWRLLHVGAVLALPSWPMRVIALLSWPFWFDVEAGNIVVFVVVVAAWALRGSRGAAVAYLVLLVLIPRPLMVPVAAWLLWQHRSLRVPFIGLLAAHAVVVVVGGWASDWLSALLAASDDVGNWSNVGPSRFIGTWWMATGLPLAFWLTLRGRLGWASLCASPYWLPYYLLMLLLELRPPRADPGKQSRNRKKDEPLAPVLRCGYGDSQRYEPDSISLAGDDDDSRPKGDTDP